MSLFSSLFEPKRLGELAPAPKVFVYGALLFWTLVVFFPLYWMTVTSFKEPVHVSGGPLYVPFIDFEPWRGERTFLAKASIRNVCMVNVPRAQNLNQRLHDLDGFDPHAILGLVSTASFDDVKAAWHRLAKVYHPDRYSAAELPPEVRDYLANMARRVNAAYAALEAPMQATRRASHRAQPVYTSQSR